MTDKIKTASCSFDSRRRPPASRGLGGEGAQGLVELALTLPLLLFILAGAAELARFGWASIEAANAARAGVQYAAQSNITASDTSGIQTAALNDGTNLSGLSVVSSHSCACSNAPSTSITCSTALSTCLTPNVIIEYVTVTTSGSIASVFRWPGLPASFTATGSATMEVEQ